jgi:hypothetical protein
MGIMKATGARGVSMRGLDESDLFSHTLVEDGGAAHGLIRFRTIGTFFSKVKAKKQGERKGFIQASVNLLHILCHFLHLLGFSLSQAILAVCARFSPTKMAFVTYIASVETCDKLMFTRVQWNCVMLRCPRYDVESCPIIRLFELKCLRYICGDPAIPGDTAASGIDYDEWKNIKLFHPKSGDKTTAMTLAQQSALFKDLLERCCVKSRGAKKKLLHTMRRYVEQLSQDGGLDSDIINRNMSHTNDIAARYSKDVNGKHLGVLAGYGSDVMNPVPSTDAGLGDLRVNHHDLLVSVTNMVFIHFHLTMQLLGRLELWVCCILVQLAFQIAQQKTKK